jgi:hypothetical protein
MVKNIARKENIVTREFLVKELRSFGEVLNERFERRLDERLAMQTESLKDYIHAGFSQMDLKFEKIDQRFDILETKLKVSVKGLVEMITRGFGKYVQLDDSVKDHERRIVALEPNR